VNPAPSFRQTDRERLAMLVAERGFGLIVGVDGRDASVAHAPIILRDDRLLFHLSAANRLSQVLRTAGSALAVVTGDDAYVSPDWYAVADQVPTWNYLSVEIEGPVRVLARAQAIELLDDLTAHFEAPLAPKPLWTRAKMNPAKFEAMLDGITAFEMRIERLEGIAKLSQNKPTAEVERVARHLAARPDAGSRGIAARMISPPEPSEG